MTIEPIHLKFLQCIMSYKNSCRVISVLFFCYCVVHLPIFLKQCTQIVQKFVLCELLSVGEKQKLLSVDQCYCSMWCHLFVESCGFSSSENVSTSTCRSELSYCAKFQTQILRHIASEWNSKLDNAISNSNKNLNQKQNQTQIILKFKPQTTNRSYSSLLQIQRLTTQQKNISKVHRTVINLKC